MSQNPRSGKPRLTDIRSDRRIQRMALKSKNVRSLNYWDFPVANLQESVHRLIIESSYMIHAKMARRLPLSKFHISKRLQWARNHMSYGDKWMAVLFSDEKIGTSMDLTGI
ncbi:hypothetical protein AVEN_140884-1 [Araneus ventricosus]|uniref:Transposase Tc1-like domain-containing protein n=1 Tax=Araneus ventricosus TaxID=182803 RepID=A0A4Y2TV13_ARAVE|nr:hypothetical protein AVEN_140884-1 [Araneus ventricosus]